MRDLASMIAEEEAENTGKKTGIILGIYKSCYEMTNVKSFSTLC